MLSRVIDTAYVYYTALAAVFHSRLVHFHHDLSQFLYCVVKSFGLYDLYVNFGEAKSFHEMLHIFHVTIFSDQIFSRQLKFDPSYLLLSFILQ